MEKVCDAFGRLPPISATVRSWTPTEWHRRAINEVRRSKTGQIFAFPASPNGGEPLTEVEELEHLLLVPQRRAYRVETAAAPPHLVICDGTTTWTQIAPSEVLRQPWARLQSPAVPLLDSCWLAGYHWDTPTRDTRNGREVLRMAVRLTPNPMGPRTSGLFAALAPRQAEVVIDAELGFLHQMIGLADGKPYMDIELVYVDLRPEIDQDDFQIDESQYRVRDHSEFHRRDRLSLLQHARRFIRPPLR